MTIEGLDAAKQLCGCQRCGGLRNRRCVMLEVLPHVLQADVGHARSELQRHRKAGLRRGEEERKAQMKVKILIEFDVEVGDDADFELDESVAKSAASMAAWNNLCLTLNGLHVAETCGVHVDGYGECVVKLGEDHE